MPGLRILNNWDKTGKPEKTGEKSTVDIHELI